jgi:hypothetical protein
MEKAVVEEIGSNKRKEKEDKQTKWATKLGFVGK